MPPATASARVPDAPNLLQAYVASLMARGRANRSFLQGARAFLARWPDPQDWASEPLEVRLATGGSQWSLLNFLMFWGHLQPGYDYLVERKLSALWREMPFGPWGAELRRYQAAAQALGYGRRTCAHRFAIAARLLIKPRPLIALTEQDFVGSSTPSPSVSDGMVAVQDYRTRCRAHRDLPPGQRNRTRSRLYPVAMELGAPSEGVLEPQ
jgi:hypothetical protein